MPSSLNGTGITFSNGTTQSTAATGTVSSVATGNGLSGGTITTSGTLTVAAPGFNTVGSYTSASFVYTAAVASGGSISAGGGTNQVKSAFFNGNRETNNLSGTWRNMSASLNANCCGSQALILVCRIS